MGYQNLIPNSNVTANELPGYEKENAFDWFTYTWWRSNETNTAYYSIGFDTPVLNPDFSEGFGENDIPNGWTITHAPDVDNYYVADEINNRITYVTAERSIWLRQDGLTIGKKMFGIINIHATDNFVEVNNVGDAIFSHDTPGIYFFEFIVQAERLNLGVHENTTATINSLYLFEQEYFVDYFGIAAHNLDTIENSSVEVQYYDGNIWTEYDSKENIDFNSPIFFIGENIFAPAWRFRFNFNAIAPLVGVLSLGTVKEMPEGIRPEFVPPPIAFDSKVFNSESVTGQFLGRSIERFGYMINIRQNLIDPAWMLENWPELAFAIQTQPFFWSWNYEQFPEHTVYAWLDGDLPRPTYTDPLHMQFSFNARALHLIRWY